MFIWNIETVKRTHCFQKVLTCHSDMTEVLIGVGPGAEILTVHHDIYEQSVLYIVTFGVQLDYVS